MGRSKPPGPAVSSPGAAEPPSVRVEADADEPMIIELVEHADHLNPMLANLAPSIVRSHRLTVIAPGPGGPTGDRS